MIKWVSVFSAFFFFGCNQFERTFNGFEKMIGKWKAADGDMAFYETWEQKGERMIGGGIILQGKDTAFGEKLIVEYINNKLVYIADVQGQSPVMFTCTKMNEANWIFENSDHNFPNKISYNLISSTKLLVILEGVEENVAKKEQLNFTKIQDE